MSTIFEVKNISKSFKVYSSELKRVLSWFGLRFKPRQENQVLKNISFSIAHGEAVGIVGQNGAGKSTLLKIITGTLKPSEGSIHIGGRVAAILELGMGFHPDLTGRQNVYHSAGLMGFTVAEIDAVIDEIEDFAEIGEYFDQPVRTYSSGMQLRVAFGVVTAYRPDILIIDEAMSVGDAYFQHKSLSRIREFQKQGTTLLLVSHDKGAIQAICNRAILLEKGCVLKDGDPEEVMDFYNALIADKETKNIEQSVNVIGKVQTVSGSADATVSSIGLYNDQGQEVVTVGVGEGVKLSIGIKVHKPIPSLVLGYMIKDRLGQVVFGETSMSHGVIYENLKVNQHINFTVILPLNIGVGSYSIATALSRGKSHVEGNIEWKDLAFLFDVVNLNQKDFVGSVWMQTSLIENKSED